jgi:hypothetical protein
MFSVWAEAPHAVSKLNAMAPAVLNRACRISSPDLS